MKLLTWLWTVNLLRSSRSLAQRSWERYDSSLMRNLSVKEVLPAGRKNKFASRMNGSIQYQKLRYHYKYVNLKDFLFIMVVHTCPLDVIEVGFKTKDFSGPKPLFGSRDV